MTSRLEQPKRTASVSLTGGLILLLAAVLRLDHLAQGGLGNQLYAAAVRSMLDSSHNWLYAAFEPGGTVSIDKPPLAYWFQSLSALAYGFNGLSLRLPQALAGTLAVGLLTFGLVPEIGPAASLLSGLALAVLPIAVTTDRTNAADSIAALAMTAAAVLALRGIRLRRCREILLAALILGLGFNAKMFEAFLPLPAFALLFGVCWTGPAIQRASAALRAGAILLATSLSWAVFDWLTPVAGRPAIMNSPANSIWQLIFVYNGWQRLFPGARLGPPALIASQTLSLGPEPGPFRLLSGPGAIQIGLLLVPAALGAIVLVRQWRHGRRQEAFLWGGWLITGLVLLSFSGHLAPQYLEAIATPAAVLTGIGLAELWEAACSDRRFASAQARWQLALATIVLASGGYNQLVIVPLLAGSVGAGAAEILSLLTIGVGAIAIVLQLASALNRPEGRSTSFFQLASRILAILAVIGVLGLPLIRSGSLVAPVEAGVILGRPPTWPSIADSGGRPATVARHGAPPPLATGLPTNDTAATAVLDGLSPHPVSAALAGYLRAQRGSMRFVVAVQGYAAAAPLILALNAPVLILYDEFTFQPTVPVQTIDGLVRRGDLKYLLISEPTIEATDPALAAWVNRGCQDVPGVQVPGSDRLVICGVQ